MAPTCRDPLLPLGGFEAEACSVLPPSLHGPPTPRSHGSAPPAPGSGHRLDGVKAFCYSGTSALLSLQLGGGHP